MTTDPALGKFTIDTATGSVKDENGNVLSRERQKELAMRRALARRSA